VERCTIEVPLGRCFEIVADRGLILSAGFVARRKRTGRINEPVLREAVAQTRAYFAKRLAVFDLPLRFTGTPLQCEAWRAVSTLQFGHFVSYAEVARAIGRPRSHRGVAAAMGKTTIDLFVPAHRVLGSDGKLKGCAPGSVRARLAAFERANAHLVSATKSAGTRA
jgi:methylated-DNA-[protein]-cysteine S-methyltransferase